MGHRSERPSVSEVADLPVQEVERSYWSRSDVEFQEGAFQSDVDFLAIEEPLQIRFGKVPLAVVMRTPGHDHELALGFALSEGIVQSPQDIERIAHCSVGEHTDNDLSLFPSKGFVFDIAHFQRNLYATSSCGICGKRSIEQAMREGPPLSSDAVFRASVLAAAPATLRQEQKAFESTGALHAAGLLDSEGELLVVREDIGRHNAVDKVLGWAAKNERALGTLALVISGRASYEIVQKALALRIPCVVAVGGASSLAVDLAQRAKISLAAFAREERLSIYSGAERIQ